MHRILQQNKKEMKKETKGEHDLWLEDLVGNG